MAVAVCLSASGSVAAQTEAAGEMGQEEAPVGEWPVYPTERHFIGRVIAGSGLRLNDAFAAGVLAPPFVLVDGNYLFKNVGGLRMGPRIGVQAGFDIGHAPVQFTVQPGWFMLGRSGATWAWTARIDLPVLFTRGPNVLSVAQAPGYNPPVRAALDRPYTATLGLEGGVGGVYYLTAGVALTGEASAAVYLGDSFYTYPVVGAALGLMVDYEFLP